MFKIITILLALFIISCGNKKPNKLPDGVIDKSIFPFPPSDEYEYPCVYDESPLLCEINDLIKNKNEKNLVDD